jgi:Ca2+-transporting ATPase
MNKKDLFKLFNQSDQGFTDSEVRKLHDKYGFNELEEGEKESILDKILEQFQDTLVRILLLAAVISFIIALTSSNI